MPRRRIAALALAVAVAVAAAGPVQAAGAAAPKRPDLDPRPGATTAFSASAGGAVGLTVTVRNAGRAKAARTRTTLRVGAGTAPAASDPTIGSVATPALKPRAKKVLRLSGTLPATSGATWRIFVCADGARRVRESDERDNCRVWRTYSTPASVGLTPAPPTPTPPAATRGPSGGATSVCDGRPTVYRPYPRGTAVRTGVDLTVGTSDETVQHLSMPVGAFESSALTPVSITNTGTATLKDLRGLSTIACGFAPGGPPLWGRLSTDDAAIPFGDQCFGTLAPGESCHTALVTSNITAGGPQEGVIQLTAGFLDTDADVVAVFRVRTDPPSRGWSVFSLMPGSASLTSLTVGQKDYVYVRLENQGDRSSSTSVEFTPGDGTGSAIAFSAASSDWTPTPDLPPKCAPSGGAPQLAPGASCSLRFAVCVPSPADRFFTVTVGGPPTSVKVRTNGSENPAGCG